MTRARVVIVGGGFAGISAARRLRHAPVDVVVIDRTNHFLFQPLLYQVATGGLAPSDIAVPIRWLLRKQRNTTVLLGDVTAVDTTARRVAIDGGAHTVPYDFLLVAGGARHAYFSHDEWERHAPGLKTLPDALAVRESFLLAFENAEKATDAAEQRAWLTMVIVGGGPTGVELAGMMSTIARTALPRDFRRSDPAATRVILLEAGERLLAAMPPELSAEAQRELEELGVEVRLGARVTEVRHDGVRYERVDAGEFIASRAAFWAAGNRAAPLGRQLGGPTDSAGRVEVAPDLSVPGHPEIFVAGDMAAVRDRNGRLVPGVSPAANQQGRHAAENILRTIARQERRPFVYRNKGDLATIGRHRAVADFGRLTVSGAPAWWLWVVVHIFYLAGFRNRLSVMLQWAWSYVTYQRGVRLIVRARDAGGAIE